MKEFLLLLSCLSCFATIANAQIPHVIPLKGVLIDWNADWTTGLGGYIRTDNNGGHINTSSSGGYIHTQDVGGNISTAHHGGYIGTNYNGGAINTSNTGGGIFTNNGGGTVNTSSSGAGIITSGYAPKNGDSLIFNVGNFLPQATSSIIICTGSTQTFTSGTTLNFSIVIKDVRSNWNTSTSRLTPSAGYYNLIFSLYAVSNQQQVSLRKNGSTYRYFQATTSDTTINQSWSISIYANGTDYFDIYINPISSTENVYAGNYLTTYGTFLTVIPIQ